MIRVERQLASESPEDWLPTLAQCERWCNAALQSQGEWEVTVRLVDNEESQLLNASYRGKDKPTNVLSFPFENPPGIPEDELPPEQVLGDLILCVPLVKEEAEAQGKKLESHWAHLLIHGTLHLQGYDHVLDQDAELMENLEIHILNRLGYANPYQPN